ncbi:unnamed protein product [Zymoseptoria tritici ST99CH_1E4]|uniref:Zn(2)-C6 fungal-type domain-containing protein n=1 Tax=Zymoseptoria tritici ST99CH_1E4 TaxID=1276532 RepID=A0A2H1FKX0_ZYMTR|nr:unnamed protein product [Zymoseptoria tritici ST99CH_1E4]
MVYRGKPSAGCENCRKAKKRCDLEQPACSRCVKLKKPCSGYRDTSQLQIQDESEAVRLKAHRAKNRPSPASTKSSTSPAGSFTVTPASSFRDRTPPDEDVKFSTSNDNQDLVLFNNLGIEDYDNDDELTDTKIATIPHSIKPSIDDAATNYFFSQFTSPTGHWNFVLDGSHGRQMEPVLDLGLRACGMAALDNVKGSGSGLVRSRVLYAKALGMLNAALRDPKHCKTDQSLVAVTLLGLYENLTCDSRESIQSWKAHTSGASELLKLRGGNQFETLTGRMLFRETRAQVLISCMWDDLPPPPILREWEEVLNNSPEAVVAAPADRLSAICVDFATLKYQMRTQTISDQDAIAEVIRLEMRMVQWSIDTMADGQVWSYSDVEVPDSPHVWNGVVHGYQSHPSVPSIWNTYRSVRIMLTRNQETLVRRFDLPPEQMIEQMAYLKSVRRQMTDDVCRSVPTLLGHGAPAVTSPCIITSAYGAIWPLFFAGTCALERIDLQAWAGVVNGTPMTPSDSSNAAIAQALWIIGRLEYISKHIGLKWAEGVSATLKGDLQIHDDILPDGLQSAFWETLVQTKPGLMQNLNKGKAALNEAVGKIES